jgi:hypothetical protein
MRLNCLKSKMPAGLSDRAQVLHGSVTTVRQVHQHHKLGFRPVGLAGGHFQQQIYGLVGPSSTLLQDKLHRACKQPMSPH